MFLPPVSVHLKSIAVSGTFHRVSKGGIALVAAHGRTQMRLQVGAGLPGRRLLRGRQNGRDNRKEGQSQKEKRKTKREYNIFAPLAPK